MAKPTDGAGEATDARRRLPSVDRLLQTPEARAWLVSHPRDLVVEALRGGLDEARQAMARGTDRSPAVILAWAGARIDRARETSLRPVINGTGVILHTNLGRAPLSPATLAAMVEVGRGYSSLEYDLQAGGRGSRHEHVTQRLRRLTGAEAALVVNNNASAVLLALAATAAGREVVISRGQLVEIGGGFRIPDVLRESGAQLVEVGTTNRTYIADYAAAITADTAVLLRVHASNFRVSGFVHAAELTELVTLARERGLRAMDDLGSGSLLPTERYGLAHEPMVQESVAAGADLVCFSGDKLLGAPQAGIIVGKAETVALLRRHPLTRAVRPDKATLAGLHATLVHYERNEVEREVPVWRMLCTPAAELEGRARAIAAATPGRAVSVQPCQATVGGGSLPGETLPSWAAVIGRQSADEIAARLRRLDPPIVGRVADGRVWLDLRTVAPEEDAVLVEALRRL